MKNSGGKLEISHFYDKILDANIRKKMQRDDVQWILEHCPYMHMKATTIEVNEFI